MTTVLVIAGIREENPPRLRLTLQQERALASAKNDMCISWKVNQKPVSSMALEIILINVRSWDILVLSTLKISLLSNMGIIPYQGNVLTGS